MRQRELATWPDIQCYTKTQQPRKDFRRKYWLYVLVISRTRFRVSPYSIVSPIWHSSLAEQLSVLLRTKWFWVRAKLQSLVIIDNKLFFDEHIITIRKTANKKLNALNRISYYMKQNQKDFHPSFSSFISAIARLFGCFAPKNVLKDKCCSWKIFTDYSKWLRVSLPLIIRGITPNSISPTMYKILEVGRSL